MVTAYKWLSAVCQRTLWYSAKESVFAMVVADYNEHFGMVEVLFAEAGVRVRRV